MKITSEYTRRYPATSVLAAASVILAFGCVHPDGSKPRSTASEDFATVRPVIERTCLHCHGADHLPGMPSFRDTAALAAITGKGGYIVPGDPEHSRFFNVVTLSDNQAGAMPPTGHAISGADVAKLRAWIAAGARVPEGPPVILTPRGIPPRSR